MAGFMDYFNQREQPSYMKSAEDRAREDEDRRLAVLDTLANQAFTPLIGGRSLINEEAQRRENIRKNIMPSPVEKRSDIIEILGNKLANSISPEPSLLTPSAQAKLTPRVSLPVVNSTPAANNTGLTDEELAALEGLGDSGAVPASVPATMPTLPVTGKEKESNELSRIDDLINSLKPSDKDREFNRRMALANMFFKIASSKEPTFFGAVGKGMSESIPDVTKAYSQYMPEVSLNQANLLSKLAADKLEREKMAADIDYKNRYLDVLKSNKSDTGADKSANYYKGLAQLNYNQAKNIRAANKDVMGQVIDPNKEALAQKYDAMADQYSNAAASALGFVAPAESQTSNTDTILDFDTATGTFK